MAVEIQTPIEHPVTLDEFLSSYDGVRAEWVQGQVIDMSPVNSRHYDIVSFLRRLFEAATDEVGGKVYADVFAFKTELGSIRVPDLIALKAENVFLAQATFVTPTADLVIEVISPDSFERDRGRKFLEYEEASVKEYWIIDPHREVAEFYTLEDKRFRVIPISDGIYTSSTFPMVKIQTAWLWQDPLPAVKPILRDLGL